MQINHIWLLGLSIINRCFSAPTIHSTIGHKSLFDKNLIPSSFDKLDIHKSFTNDLFNLYTTSGSINNGIKKAERDLDLAMKSNNKAGNVDIARAYVDLGNVYKERGVYSKASANYNKALDILLKIYDQKHPDIISIYVNLGDVHHLIETENKSGITKIKKELRDKIANYKNHPVHQEIVEGYRNLGWEYLSVDNYDNAIKIFTKGLALALATSDDTSQNGEIFNICYGLGLCYYQKEETDQAISCFIRARDILHESSFDIENTDTIRVRIYKSLAELYTVKENYENATNNYLQALEILTLLQDADSTDLTTSCYYSLGQIYYNQTNYAEAIEQFGRALEILEPAQSESEIELSVSCHLSLANIYRNIGELDIANQEFIKAITLDSESAYLRVEYAQFLIVNSGSELLSVDDKEISQYLYSVILQTNIDNDNNESRELMYYDKQDQNFVCGILRDIIEDSTTPVKINPKLLAYYLLVKHPKYIEVSTDHIRSHSDEDILNLTSHESFGKFCNEIGDEISLRFLEDIQKNGTYGHHNTYQDPSLLGVMKTSSNQNAEYTFDIDNSIATDLIGASSVDENEL